jgi:hypothetical protein
MTDVGFQNAITAVSAQGGVRWGVEHLYYEVCRRKRLSPRQLGCGLAVVLFFLPIAVILAVKLHPTWWFAVAGLPVIAVVLITGMVRARFVRVDNSTFRRMWTRWCQTHGTPAGVIIRQEPPAKPAAVEPDLADYSFDRAVICDRARTVDLLLANHFHFENNCAVLSEEGYPPGPFETVRAMLKRNPRLQVFVLHDATVRGCRLAHRLANDPLWFAGQVRVIDVGLRPAHADRFYGLFTSANHLRVQPTEGITPQEAQWLSRYLLELAVIRPEQVLKRLFRAINHPPDPSIPAVAGVVFLGRRKGEDVGSGGTGGGDGDGASFAAEAGESDGGVDAFG